MKTLPSYDAIPYESIPITETHVEGLAALGRLFGVASADPRRCRVLELGCAEGGNLLPMAFYLPGSEFVGIDLSARQIEDGRRLIAELGLRNITLLHRDVMEGADDLGRFDYIIAHGLYSWVPAPVRQRVLAILAANLAPNGIAYVSWNALPGWHTRALMRDMLRHHTREASDARIRLDMAYMFLEAYGAAFAAEAGELAPILEAEVEYLKQAPPSYLYHEYLTETNEPMLFSDFMAQARGHGLRYVADVDLHTLLPETLGEAGGRVAAEIDEREARIQAMDFMRARRFHRSLLTHAATPVGDLPDLTALRALAFHADLACDQEIDLHGSAHQAFVTPTGARYAIKHPLAKAAAMWLSSAYPNGVAYVDLQQAAAGIVATLGDATLAQEEDALAGELLDLLAWGALRVAVHPGALAAEPPARPRAHALARAQLMHGSDCVASVRHTAVHLDEAGAHLLGLLDGRRDLDGLVEAMRTALDESLDPAAIRAACARLLWTFARNGLLEN